MQPKNIKEHVSLSVVDYMKQKDDNMLNKLKDNLVLWAKITDTNFNGHYDSYCNDCVKPFDVSSHEFDDDIIYCNCCNNMWCPDCFDGLFMYRDENDCTQCVDPSDLEKIICCNSCILNFHLEEDFPECMCLKKHALKRQKIEKE